MKLIDKTNMLKKGTVLAVNTIKLSVSYISCRVGQLNQGLTELFANSTYKYVFSTKQTSKGLDLWLQRMNVMENN